MTSVARKIIERGGGGRDNIIDFNQYDRIRRHQAALLGAHMLLDDVPISRVAFLLKIYPLFLENDSVNGMQMAKMFGCTHENIRRYRQDLEDRGYLERVSYRGWVLSDTYLTQLNRM